MTILYRCVRAGPRDQGNRRCTSRHSERQEDPRRKPVLQTNCENHFEKPVFKVMSAHGFK